MAPGAREKMINTLPVEEQLTLVLLAPWEKRNEIICSSRRAGDLVRAIPPEELFWTVKALGPEDSSTILSLASPAQLQLFFDLDWWSKAEIRAEKVVSWLLIMTECAKEGMKGWLKWILQKDVWLMASIFSGFVSVVKRPDDMDIQEAKDVLPAFTLDNVYYLSFKNQKLSPLFASLVGMILEISPGLYRDLFETMLGETVSHNLETAYRLRCGRLQDFGIPDYYDSLDIYLPMEPEEMHRINTEQFERLPVHIDMPPFVPTLYVSGFPVLEDAVRNLAGHRVMERIVREVTGIANKVMMADLIDLDDPEDMKDALKKTFSMLNLSMEYLGRKWSLSPAEILMSCFLEEIVRVGCRLLLPISSRAKEMAGKDAAKLLPYGMREQLKAASKRPAMLYDEATANEFYISSLEQLQECRNRVKSATCWCRILETLFPRPSYREDINWKKTNFLAVEEFTAEAALFTAASNLLLVDRLDVRVLSDEKIQRLKDILADISVDETVNRTLSALERKATSLFESSEERSVIRALVGKSIKGGFNELKNLQAGDRGGMRFLKYILAEIPE